MNKINQVHYGSGDNVTGNKITHENKVDGKKDIPVWLRYLVAFAAIFGVGWAIYIYIIPK